MKAATCSSRPRSRYFIIRRLASSCEKPTAGDQGFLGGWRFEHGPLFMPPSEKGTIQMPGNVPGSGNRGNPLVTATLLFAELIAFALP